MKNQKLYPPQYSITGLSCRDGEIGESKSDFSGSADLCGKMGRFESVDVLKNTTVVNLKNESIIIDPGAETAFMAIGKNIRCVLLTHAHFDHVNGLSELFGGECSPEIICSSFTQKFLHESQWDEIKIIRAIEDAYTFDNITNIPIEFANGLILNAYSGGHCFGNTAYHLSDGESGSSLFIGHEVTPRNVGGNFMNLPESISAEVLVVDGHFLKSETNSEPVKNHSQLHGLLTENCDRYKNIRLITNGSLGIHQDVYMAVKAWQLEAKTSCKKVIIKGIRSSVRDEIFTIAHDSLGQFPWNDEINILESRDSEPISGGIIIESVSEHSMKHYCNNCVANKNEMVICINHNLVTGLHGEENFHSIDISTHASEEEIISLAINLNAKQIVLNCNGDSTSVPQFEKKVGIKCESALKVPVKLEFN